MNFSLEVIVVNIPKGRLHNNMDDTMSQPRLWTPVPDPTALTTQQLQREIAALKELFETRFDAYDKAIDLLQRQADRVPSIAVVDERIDALRTLHDERFHGIDVRLVERDLLRQQWIQGNEQAISKSENATTKIIDQINSTFVATTRGVNDKIDDVKDRISKIESEGRLYQGRGQGQKDTWGSISGTIITVGAGIAAVIAIVAYIHETLSK